MSYLVTYDIIHSAFCITSLHSVLTFCVEMTMSESLIIGTEAVAKRCSVKKVFLEISQNSQESTCARVSFFNNSFLIWRYIFFV